MFSDKTTAKLIAFIGAATLIGAAWAHEFRLGTILIGHPYARATVAQQTTGAAYFGLDNQGKTDDKLLKVESSAAKSVEIHNMEMAGDVMKMREVDGIELKAGSKISMAPGGGFHLMLIGLTRQLVAGDKIPLTLYFAKAGKIEVIAHVEADAGNGMH